MFLTKMFALAWWVFFTSENSKNYKGTSWSISKLLGEFLLIICLVGTFFTSSFLLFSRSGVYAGIKFFIIDFMFKSCPKLRDKYDTPYIVWNSLPTDPQLKERTNATVSRRVRTPSLFCYTNCWCRKIHTTSML